MIPKLLLTASLLLVSALGCDCNQPECDGPTCDPFAIGQAFTPPTHYWVNDDAGLDMANDTSTNLAALHETKNGGCPTCPQAQPQTYRPVYQGQTSPYSQSHSVPPIRLNPGESLLWVQPLSQTRPTQQTTMPRPTVSRPTASTPACPTGQCPLHPPPTADDIRDNVKEGIFRCSMCGKATVGREWHELWTDDRISLTCMCEHCWRRSSPSQIESTIRNYAAATGVNVRSATVQAVIREASAK